MIGFISLIIKLIEKGSNDTLNKVFGTFGIVRIKSVCYRSIGSLCRERIRVSG